MRSPTARDSSDGFAHAGDVELGRELQQANKRWASIRCCSRVSLILNTVIANNTSAFATGTEPAPSKSTGVGRSTISASMPELANSRSTLTPDGHGGERSKGGDLPHVRRWRPLRTEPNEARTSATPPPVIGDSRGDIDAACKPHLCANGHRKTVDPCEPAAQPHQFAADCC